MRRPVAACVLAIATACQVAQQEAPEEELRRALLAELPRTMASLVGPAERGEWHCRRRGDGAECIGGPTDSLTVMVHALNIDPGTGEGTVALTAFGPSAVHYRPRPPEQFWVMVYYTFRREGGQWRTVKRTVAGIS